MASSSTATIDPSGNIEFLIVLQFNDENSVLESLGIMNIYTIVTPEFPLIAIVLSHEADFILFRSQVKVERPLPLARRRFDFQSN
mgnify:FL=1